MDSKQWKTPGPRSLLLCRYLKGKKECRSQLTQHETRDGPHGEVKSICGRMKEIINLFDEVLAGRLGVKIRRYAWLFRRLGPEFYWPSDVFSEMEHFPLANQCPHLLGLSIVNRN